MKRMIKRTLLGLLALVALLCAGIFTYTYVRFNNYTTDDSAFKTESSALKYYQPSYAECRQAFRSQAQALAKARNGVEIFSFPVESRQDKDLTIDGCHLSLHH